VSTSIATFVTLLILLAQPLAAQTETIAVATKSPASRTPVSASNAGPEKWDAAGRVRCSVDRDTFDRTCGYRAVRNLADKSADIWIRNLAHGKADYRFLRYANDSFTTNDDSQVVWGRKKDKWWVKVDGKEFYLIPDALIHGG